MSAVNAFGVGLFVMLLATGGALFLLRKSLHQLLVELCEEEHRARFWGQLYAAMVVPSVGIAGISFPPPLFEVMNPETGLHFLLPMLRAGLIGLLLCFGILAIMMVKFISERDRVRTPTA